MSKKSFINNIGVELPMMDSDFCLLYNDLKKIINSKDFEIQYEEQFNTYLNKIFEICGGIIPVFSYDYIRFDYSENDDKIILTFSPVGLYKCVFEIYCYSENSLKEETYFQNVRRKLKSIRNEQELKVQFPKLYSKIYLKNKKNEDNFKFLCRLYEECKKNFVKFNNLKKDYRQRGIDLEEKYRIAKNGTDFEFFIDNCVNQFDNFISKYQEILDCIHNNPINLMLGKENQSKVFLFIIYRLIEWMTLYSNKGDKISAQKEVLIIEKLFDKYKENFLDDIEITFNSRCILFSDEEKNLFSGSFNIKKLREIFELQLKKYLYLKTNVVLPSLDNNLSFYDKQNKIYNFIKSLLDETIEEDKNNGAVGITDKQIENKIHLLEEEIKSEQISEEKRNLNKLILEKIKMVLVDIEPKSKQTGIGIFSNYYVYFYPNGMVAIDKLEGYGALYIMPVHIYKEARYKKSLIDVRRIPGVKFINHKNREWLLNAKKYIQEGTNELTENDIIDTETVASIDFPYTLDRMNELQKQLEEDGKFTKKVALETKKRINKIKKLDAIDQELKIKSNDELSEDEFLQEEENMINVDKSFDELYDDWKKRHIGINVKRNPVVAAITKNRSRDNEGNFCCEMCNAKNFESYSFDCHHMIPLANGGIDNIYNTVCLCPNCHRYVHSKKITLYQRYNLFLKIRKHLEEENPEYISKLDEMISSIAKSEEEYQNNKKFIDDNFAMLWNSENYKLR